MDDYYITKEDWDTLVELGVGEGYEMEPVLKSIAAQTKSAFTRKCANSLVFVIPGFWAPFGALPFSSSLRADPLLLLRYTGITRADTPSPSTATPPASPRRSAEEVLRPTSRTLSWTTTTIGPRTTGGMTTTRRTSVKTRWSRTKLRSRRRPPRARRRPRRRGRRPSREGEGREGEEGGRRFCA